MKLMNVHCVACDHKFEDMVDNGVGWGASAGVACPECQSEQTIVACHAPQVRTPNNSVSFLDGHRDDGGALNFGYEKWKVEREATRLKMKEGRLDKAKEVEGVRKEMNNFSS